MIKALACTWRHAYTISVTLHNAFSSKKLSQQASHHEYFMHKALKVSGYQFFSRKNYVLLLLSYAETVQIYYNSVMCVKCDTNFLSTTDKNMR